LSKALASEALRDVDVLTDAQIDVLLRVGYRESGTEIAKRLGRTTASVESSFREVRRKMGFHDKMEAYEWVTRNMQHVEKKAAARL